MTRTRRRGGGPLPLQYFGAAAPVSAEAGSDRLAVQGNTVRPSIGGKRRKSRSKRRMRGGFYPSVMGNFTTMASKYIVPIALFAGYKLLGRFTKKGKKRATLKRK